MDKLDYSLDQRYQYIGFLPNSVRIKENGFWGLNDYEGNTILPSNYIEVFTLSSGYGLIAARDAGSWDIYDYQGNKLNSERLDALYPYYGLFGMTKIKIGQNWGMINKYGRIIIPVEYRKIDKFGKGMVLQNNNSEIEFIELKDLIKLNEVENKPIFNSVKTPLSKRVITLAKKKSKPV